MEKTSIARADLGVPLRGGHVADVFVSAGGMGFDGRGYWWQRPAHWVGIARPGELTVVTKTLTRSPRRGNWRAWVPWRSFRLLGEGNTVNAMGLPNMGLKAWTVRCLPGVQKAGLNIVPSLWSASKYELSAMIDMLSWEKYEAIVAVELNLSCPNIHGGESDPPEELAREAAKAADGRLPIIAKLGCDEYARQAALGLDEHVAAVSVINAVPWDQIYQGRISPLEKYGYKGAVSGPAIVPFARSMTDYCVKHLKHARVISGGGIRTTEEAMARIGQGAAAVSVGTGITFSPGRANRIARGVRAG